MGRIEVEIDEDGNVSYKTTGFIGKACMVVGKAFKKGLAKFGVEIESDDVKPTGEMYATEGGQHVRQELKH